MLESGLDGKVVAITGGGKGIGRALARDLAAAGAKVAICSRTEADLVAVTEEIEAAGGSCAYVAVDLATWQGAEDLVSCAVERFGRLDAFVNNAAWNRLRPALDFSESDVDWILNVNLKAIYGGCVAAAKAMIAQGDGGVIVNVSSQAGIVGAPSRAPYSAAKAGVINLTRTLAAEWAEHGIRVNCLAPGATRTDAAVTLVSRNADIQAQVDSKILLGRMGEEREMTGPAMFLLSSAATYITGHTLVVDGGWTIV